MREWNFILSAKDTPCVFHESLKVLGPTSLIQCYLYSSKSQQSPHGALYCKVDPTIIQKTLPDMDRSGISLGYLSFPSCALLNCTPRKSCTRCKRPEGSSKDVADSKGYQLL